jgi:hypothetical protein
LRFKGLILGPGWATAWDLKAAKGSLMAAI